jgi:dolichol kinase
MMLVILGSLASLLLLLDYSRLKNKALNERIFKVFSSVLKEKEKTSISSTTVFFLVMFSAVLLFSKPTALISLCFLIFPDIASALVGSIWGKRRIVRGKTLEGSFAFFVTCIIIGIIFRGLGFNFNWIAIFASAFLASMVELIPYIDDNISVPLVAGFTFKFLS